MGNSFVRGKYYSGIKPTKPKEDRILREDYQLVAKIGEGCFGGVYRAKLRKSGKYVAIKKIIKKEIKKPKRFRNEVWSLIQMDHPNIIKFYDFYKESKYYFLITDLAQGGELLDKFDLAKASVSESDCSYIVKQMAEAISFMHSIGISHRDLKPANFLWDRKGPIQQCTLKLCDFGFSRQTSGDMQSTVGTPYYVAPEVVKKKKGHGYGEKCDIWSIGIITYFLLSGKHPFEGTSISDLITSIAKNPVSFNEPTWENITELAKDFILSCLEKNPDFRCSAQGALFHIWISKPELSMTHFLGKKIVHNVQQHHQKTTFRKMVEKAVIHYACDESKFGQLMVLFQRMDCDKKGLITNQNFCHVLSSVGISHEVAEKTFQLFRSDNKGTIHYTEFLCNVIDKQQRVMLFQDTTAIRTAFEFIDDDKTGFLSKRQIKKFLKFAAVEYSQTISMEVDEMTEGLLDYDDFEQYVKRSHLLQKSIKRTTPASKLRISNSNKISSPKLRISGSNKLSSFESSGTPAVCRDISPKKIKPFPV